MRVYVTGKIKGMTKKDVKKIVENMGYKYSSFSQTTDVLVYGSRPGPSKMNKAREWGIRTASWDEFQKSKKSDFQTEDEEFIVLKGHRTSGPTKCSILKTAKMVTISKKLTRIDLNGIDEIPNLSRLHLEDNRLARIDLSPLSKAGNLSWLMLSCNKLSSVDLTPLSSCANLSVLEIASNRLESINLQPLSNCTMLHTLNLMHNKIEEIDLSPLGQCTQLRNLYLSSNRLEKLDLKPLHGATFDNLLVSDNKIADIDLSGISSIRKLDLSGNLLERLDFSEVASRDSFAEVNLSNNQLSTFDLAPFAESKYLSKLLLRNNKINAIDLTPVYENWNQGYASSKVKTSEARKEHYRHWDGGGDKLLAIDEDVVLLLDPIYRDRVTSSENDAFAGIVDRIDWIIGPELAREVYKSEGWSGLKKRLAIIPESAALSALSMSELGGLRDSMLRFIEHIPRDATFDEGLAELYRMGVIELRDRLKTWCNTSKLDIEKMQETEAAVLIPQILAIRRKEIQSVLLQADENGQVNLDDFYHTYYGKLLRKELGLGWKTDREGVQKLNRALRKVGMEVTIKGED